MINLHSVLNPLLGAANAAVQHHRGQLRAEVEANVRKAWSEVMPPAPTHDEYVAMERIVGGVVDLAVAGANRETGPLKNKEGPDLGAYVARNPDLPGRPGLPERPDAGGTQGM